MKQNTGKIVAGIVIIFIVLTVGWVLSSIFSKPSNIDMFIVWLIFAAEGMKNLFLGNWKNFFVTIGSIFLVIYCLYCLIRYMAIEGKGFDKDFDIVSREEWDDKDENKFKRWGKPFLHLGILFMSVGFGMQFLAAGIPNAKQAAVIYIVPKIINNADMREIPPNLAKLMNEGLKEMIEGVNNDTQGAFNEVREGVKDAVSDTIQEGAEKVKEKIKGEK